MPFILERKYIEAGTGVAKLSTAYFTYIGNRTHEYGSLENKAGIVTTDTSWVRDILRLNGTREVEYWNYVLGLSVYVDTINSKMIELTEGVSARWLISENQNTGESGQSAVARKMNTPLSRKLLDKQSRRIIPGSRRCLEPSPAY